MICVMVLLISNLLVTLKLAKTTNCLKLSQQNKRLPCEAIPTRFVLEDPECADKLVRTMDLDNVRIRKSDIVEAERYSGNETGLESR